MGRASNNPDTPGGFAAVFGTRRGSIALGEILSGADTPTVRVQIAQLAGGGDIETALRVLRELRDTAFDNDLYRPLRDAVVTAAAQPIPEAEWCLAALSFLSMIGFQPEAVQFKCEDPQHAMRNALDGYGRDRYAQAATDAMHKDLRRGISHLRTKAQVQTWLTSNGVQSALMRLVLDRLQGEGGERLLERLLGEDCYERWRERLAAVEVSKVKEALDTDELWDRMCKLLPYGPGAFLADEEGISDVQWAYDSAVARGFTRLQAEAQLRRAEQEREAIGAPTLAQ